MKDDDDDDDNDDDDNDGDDNDGDDNDGHDDGTRLFSMNPYSNASPAQAIGILMIGTKGPTTSSALNGSGDIMFAIVSGLSKE